MVIPMELLVAGGFYTFAAAAIAGAISLIIARNVFHSALFLTLTLASAGGVFVILGADFLAAVQLLIYVGAVMILILFGLMLTPQDVELPNLSTPGQAISGAIVAAAIFVVSAATLLSAQWSGTAAEPSDVATTEQIGVSLFTTFVLPFEIASVLFLVAMIGAIVIARER
ncbi:MAG: NADH-quinone oxidoreductase subunit J [Chloroflexi bacterium]|nr:NADH-quinone oxidoreductase subunit J [Chloroflexota bacterium]